MNLHRSVLALAILLSTASTAACGGSAAPTATTSPTSATSDGAGPRSAPIAPIANVWRSRCSQCHTPVEPKTRDRAQLQAALSRHHNRTHLTDAQWDEMIDFLAR